MAFLNISKIFSKFSKGEQGESYVCESISSLLKSGSKDNYYLIPKARLEGNGIVYEIDLLLLHPTLGVYIIEVKNWDSLELIHKKSPYEQANKCKNIVLSLLNDNFKDYSPINVEMRVIFPSISKQSAKDFFSKNPYEANMQSLTFFKEDLENKEIFSHFFKSISTKIPNRKEFLKITSLLVPSVKKSDQVIPIITKDEVLFFDQKQLGIMNGYKDGFRIIRGVAGTGKTIILTNFVAQRLSKGYNENFLILCFNKNLEESIKESFGENYNPNQIKISSIFRFLWIIKFDFAKVGITKETPLSKQYEIFESDIALKEFRMRLKEYLKSNPIDYMLCDETQDMPEGFMRIIYEEIKDCVFFIDEAQRFYSYAMQSIAQIFHHSKFEKLSMQGRVKNLKNVYRTPSNIAMLAFEILNKDNSLNEYYKKSYYLKGNFTDDINCVLEAGEIHLQDLSDNNNLKSLLQNLPKEENSIVLTYSKDHINNINALLKSIQRTDIKVMTIQGIKGLEAQNVIIHGFVNFLNMTQNNEKDLLYRKAYVLLTRARENIYLDFNTKATSKEVKEILDIIEGFTEKIKIQKATTKLESKNTSNNLSLAKIRPILSDTKSGAELIVAASEIFAVIAGLWTF